MLKKLKQPSAMSPFELAQVTSHCNTIYDVDVKTGGDLSLDAFARRAIFAVFRDKI